MLADSYRKKNPAQHETGGICNGGFDKPALQALNHRGATYEVRAL